MSNIIETAKPIATLSAATRKAFTSFPCADMARGLIYRDGTTDNTLVVPSDVRMTSAAAAAALGAKMTPQSFVAGLIFASVRHAHGNQFPVETLPAGSKVAIAAACETLPRGKGCNARMLLAAVEAGVAALLALPAPTARTKAVGAIAAKTPWTPPPVKADFRMASEVSSLLHECKYDEDGYCNPHLASALATAEAKAEAKARAEAKAVAEAAEAAEYRAAQVAKFAADAEAAEAAIVGEICKRSDAEKILRQLAQELGFTLRKSAARKAA